MPVIDSNAASRFSRTGCTKGVADGTTVGDSTAGVAVGVGDTAPVPTLVGVEVDVGGVPGVLVGICVGGAAQ